MNMKFKKSFIVTTLFLIVACLFTFFVFKDSFYTLVPKDKLEKKEYVLTTEAILEKLLALELVNYQGESIAIDKVIATKQYDIVIHLWASWCAPCVNEVPELIEYSKKNHNVKFIIISLDEHRDDITKFLKSFPDFNSDHYIKIWDVTNQISKYLNADRLPMSVILQKNQMEPQIIRSVINWKNFKL